MTDPWDRHQDWPPRSQRPSPQYDQELYSHVLPAPHNPVVGERVTALEVGQAHMVEAIRDHNTRLIQTDARMTHYAAMIQSLQHALMSWISDEHKRRVEATAMKDGRRTSRREALALVQYVVALGLVIGAALGAVPWEQLRTAASVLAPGQ